jgi:hypothetical protein
VTEKNPEGTTQRSEDELAVEVEALEAETRVTNTPVTDELTAGMPVTDMPEAEPPAADVPEEEAAVADASAADASDTETRVGEVIEVGTPTSETPDADEPKAPYTDAQEAEEPEAEVAQAKAPEIEEPVEDVSESLPEIEYQVASDEDTVKEEPYSDRDRQALPPSASPRTPRIRERTPSRRTTLREKRRRRSTARKSRKRTIYGILGGLVAATLILSIALPSFAGLIPSGGSSSNDTTADIPSVGTRVAPQPSSVLEDGASYGEYSVPPTSGPSYAAGLDWGIYTEQQANESIVRNLEQGAIVVNYNLSDEAQISDLTNYLQVQLGYPGCFIAQPHSGVAGGNVTLTSWGWTETYTGVDRPGMQAFVDDHRNNAPLFEGPTCGAETTLHEAALLNHAGD